ncbi:MAG: lactonase family protein [Planctomycetaceae bacterium]|nr:lactonase family protein [Planctomycetaceae bacterium]
MDMPENVRVLNTVVITLSDTIDTLCFYAMFTPDCSFAGGIASLRFFIGTYTNSGGRGIYTSRFNAEQGTLEEPSLAAECDNSTFIALHPTKPYLYAIGKFPTGMLRAFHYDKRNGHLVPLCEQEIPGQGPCHLTLCLSEDGKTDVAVVANYGSGSVVSFPVLDNGTIGVAASHLTHTGSGPNHARQQAPHVHGVYYDGSTVAVVDLGIDRVVYYRLDLVTAGLSPSGERADLRLAPGAGPRHLAVSKDQRFIYVVNELDSTVSVFDRFAPIQSISTLPVDASVVNNFPAEIELHPNGRFLYVSNRGDDSIAVFAVDQGKLTLIQTVPSGGQTPRFFCLDPTARFLLACNQDSGNICVLAVDQNTGKLSPTGQNVPVPQPACLVFAP